MRQIRVIVEGDRACFTRPEFKVDRVSYDVPTVSSMEGLLKSIHWKPSMRYVIDKIVVFNPIQYETIMTNEIKSKTLCSKVKQRINNQLKRNDEPDIRTYVTEDRTQRTSTVLKDVKYGIEFHIELTGLKSERGEETVEKHEETFMRRVRKGQSFREPCLGLAQFTVKNITLTEEFDLSSVAKELQDSEINLGYMTYRLEFRDRGVPVNNDFDNPVYSDKMNPTYIKPTLKNGVIDINKYKETIRC